MSDFDDRDDLDARLAPFMISPKLMERFARDDSPRRRGGAYEQKSMAPRGGESDDRYSDEVITTPVIIQLDPKFAAGLDEAREQTISILRDIGVSGNQLRKPNSRYYVFADLQLAQLNRLASMDGPQPFEKIWEDENVKPLLHRSSATVKADACRDTFGADGRDIVVAVADSGIDGSHPHFSLYRNLDLPSGLGHADLTGENGDPLTDELGHGTHVAGIIAGETDTDAFKVVNLSKARSDGKKVEVIEEAVSGMRILGLAPKAKIVSLKVVSKSGEGLTSSLIGALEKVEELNDYGREHRIHCVNLSLGYSFDATWYSAGQSPLCVTVDRLVRTGVVVVAAAGNDGSAMVVTEGRSTYRRISVQSINDPGNAQNAITVGATHRDSPHTHGISYFSSRGPTTDGRPKPDLVAPGERVMSCAAAGSRELGRLLKASASKEKSDVVYFRDDSGTSVAAPHVTGAVAAFLSKKKEFIGKPEEVKRIFAESCTDLGRSREFQGAGLVDLMRAFQSV
ncbi:peptidase S8/S53 subtilisin kexin sedolisin [Erythrobacter litoralis]|uniref:S8 family peptidase n=1 Tax=Erythrobacter litoralis TaxID=39960 RepID=UPI0024352309|nr:S8 family peptidase [Erythrobacter litoralis]MDG6079047.1 peptidase S8/S53 subtilisin kexin sedolisin [Erythrobacter litoralis]